MTYLFVGVVIFWVLILTYMWRLYSQQKEVSRQLEETK